MTNLLSWTQLKELKMGLSVLIRSTKAHVMGLDNFLPNKRVRLSAVQL